MDFEVVNNNVCSGVAVQFTSTVTGDGPFDYSWNFGDSTNASTPNPSHVFTSLGCTTFIFTVTLTVTDDNGVSASTSHNVTIKQRPDINFEDVNATGPANQFSNCQNAAVGVPYSITVGNISTSTCISSYSVNWGEGPVVNNISFPISHTYNQLGAYSMTITAYGANGCNSSKTYIVKNVSNPSGGINSPGSTQNLCIPTPSIAFTISNWATNSPGTEYLVDYGDNNVPEELTQEEMIASSYYNSANPGASDNYPVPHSYNTTSCPNSQFTVTLTVTNACGFTTGTISNITTTSKPIAGFTAPDKACVSSNILFSNTSIPGYDAGCNSATKYIWNFGDPASGTSNTINTGFVTAIPNASHTFSGPGIYTVTLSAQNSCGITTHIKTICVEPPLSPQFTLNNTGGCAPQTISATNTTSTTFSCTPPIYEWVVTYAAANCGTTSPGSFYASGSSASSVNPVFNFSEAGTYSIILKATNSCGTMASAPQTVNIKKPPTASINTIADFCGNASITPSAVVNGCAPTSETITYAWSFPGGSPSVSTSAIPGTIVYAVPGNYTVSLTVTNSCGSVSATEAFTINPAPLITNTVLAQTICSGTQTTAVTPTSSSAGALFSWTATATAGITGFTASGTGVIPSQTIFNSNSASGTVTYAILPTLGSCPGAVVNYVITINPAPSINVHPQPATVCQNATPVALTAGYSNGTGSPVYQWYSNSSNSTTGGTAIPGATASSYTPPTTTLGTLFYYCIISLPSGGCSNMTSNIAAFTIAAPVTILSQPVVSQNICVGGTVNTPLSINHSGGTGTATFQWFINTSNSNTGGTVIPGAASSSYTPPVFNVPQTYYYYAVVSLTGTGCGTAASNVSEVVVYPDPAVSVLPATQSVCQNAPAATLTATATGGNGTFSYQWYSTAQNNNTSGSPIGGATSATYAPATVNVGTMYYYCVVTQPFPGCSATSTQAAVTVIAAPNFTSQPAGASVCIGGAATPLSVTYTNGIGTPAYQWFSSPIPSGGTAISGATTSSYTPPTGLPGSTYYYCVITLPSSGGCSGITSDPALIEVMPLPVISVQPMVTQEVCVGAAPATPLTVSHSGGTGTASYQWYSNTSNSNSGGTLIPAATSSSYTPSAFNLVGNYYYYAVVTLSGTGCGTVTSATANISVAADPVITTQPLATQTICQLAASTVLTTAASGGSGSFSYQWYSHTVNQNSGGQLLSGATSATFTPPTALVGTLYYYCVISQTGLGCSVTSAPAQVIVNLSPVFTLEPQPATVCQGGTLQQLSVTYANGTGAPSYQWFSNNIDDTSSGNAIANETDPTFSPPSDTVGTTYYYCIVTFPATGGCSSITSEAAMVEITPGTTISQQPTASQSVCVGGSVSGALTVAYTGGTGTASYQWYANSSNSTNGGAAIAGAQSDSYAPPVFVTPGTYYFYVTVSLDGNGCGSVTSIPAAIEVVPDPVVSQQPLVSQELCQDVVPADLTFIAAGGINSSYAYQWFSNSANNTTGGTLISGATGSTFTPPTSATGTIYYYCEVTQPDGPGCMAVSMTSAVIVSPAPQFTMQPQSSTICSGESATTLSVSYSNGAGTPQYQWYSNTTNSTVGAIAITGATAATFSPPSIIAGTIYYYCVVSLPLGGCTDITSDIAMISINANPEIASVSAIICSGNAFIITPDETTGDTVPLGTTYTWSEPIISPAGSVTGASAEASPQTNISQLLVNTTTSPSTITYVVTPISGLCAGADFNITVTVNPSINANVTATDITCYGADNGAVNTNIVGGIPFTSEFPYIIEWAGPNGYTSSADDISGLAPGVYTLTITDAGGCPFTGSYTIVEPPLIQIAVDLEKDITCNGDANGEIQVALTGGTGIYTYSWTKNNVFFSTAEDLSGLSPGDYELTVTDSNNCGPFTMLFEITEPPVLTVSLVSQVNVLCYGEFTGAAVIAITGGTPLETTPGIFSYNFLWTGPNGFTSTSQNLAAITAGQYDLSVTDGHGCVKNLSVIITQPNEIVITAATTAITCYGANNASITLTVSGGAGPYQAAWNNLATGFFQDNLAAGDYIITITDATACIKIITVNIPEAPVFDVNPTVENISCHGAHDGSINLNFVGGIAPVVLTWSDGSTSGTVRNNLGPGAYTVTIVDAKPCTIIRTFTIVEPQEIILTGNITHALDCNNANSGAINLLVAGGTPPFDYSWSNGTTGEDLQVIPAGNYMVTVTDANGCIKTAQYTVTSPLPIVIDVETQTDFNCDSHYVDQTFIAHVSGGIPPYQIDWSSGTASGADNEIMNTTTNGTVLITVTDSNGCSVIHSLEVDTPELGTVVFDTGSYAYSTYGVYSVVDPIHFNSTVTGDYISIAWNFGDGTFSTEMNPVHSYVNPGNYIVTQTVIYPFGCIYIHTITLIVERGYLLVVPNAFTPNEDNINDSFKPVTKALKKVKLDVYDTWGALIYSEEGEILRGWDGKIKGVDAENGNYYCKVQAETFYGIIVHESHPFVLIK